MISGDVQKSSEIYDNEIKCVMVNVNVNEKEGFSHKFVWYMPNRIRNSESNGPDRLSIDICRPYIKIVCN